MVKSGKVWRWAVPALLVYIMGFVAAGLWDLPIDQALYSAGAGSLYAILMEAFGWWPAFLPTVLLVMVWMARTPLPKGKMWQPVLCGAILLVGGGALLYTSYNYLAKRGVLGGAGDPMAWVLLGLGVLALAGALLLVARAGPALREKLAWFGVVGSVFMLANQAVVYTVKTLWARTRFDDMLLLLGGFDDFTAWWQPFGPGGSSFPSGHTANAAGIFMLLVLCDLFPAWMRRRRLVLAGCWVYVAGMAFARILIGRHFLSDTLAASGLMAVMFYVMRHTKAYQKGLARAKVNALALKGAGGKKGGGKHAI